MSSKATAWVWTIPNLGNDRLFMLWLAENTNDDHIARLGKTEIADVLNCSTRTVTTVIQRLERRRPRILEITRRWDPDREVHFPNEYRLLIDEPELWGSEKSSPGSGKSCTRENPALGKSAADCSSEKSDLGKNLPTKNLSLSTNKKEKEGTQDQAGEAFTTAKGRKLRGIALNQFLQFIDAFGFVKRQADAGDAWFDINRGVPLERAFHERIIMAAKAERADRPRLQEAGIHFKYMTGWLRGRCWEDFDPNQGQMKERMPWYKTKRGIENAAHAAGIESAKDFQDLAIQLMDDMRRRDEAVPAGMIEFVEGFAA